MAVIIFLFQLSLLGDYHGLFVIFTIAAAAICTLGSIPKVLSATGFTVFTLSALYIALSSSAGVELRTPLTDRVNTLRFFNHFEEYRKEIAALPNPAYREWIIGNQDATQYTVIYDTSWKFKRKLYNDNDCRSHYFSPVKDYYIVTQRCG